MDEGESAVYRALAEHTKPKSTTVNDLLTLYLGKGMLELSPARSATT